MFQVLSMTKQLQPCDARCNDAAVQEADGGHDLKGPAVKTAACKMYPDAQTGVEGMRTLPRLQSKGKGMTIYAD